MEVTKITEVQYKRDVKALNEAGSGVEYLENVVTFEDGSTAIRNGITRVHGKTITEMTTSLKEATSQIGWWSLQTTSLKELKAAYRAGFRSTIGLMTLKEHIEEFEKGGTLHVQKLVLTGGNNQ